MKFNLFVLENRPAKHGDKKIISVCAIGRFTMVKTKKKEAQRFKYTVPQLKSAVAEIKQGKSVRAISKKYSIPRSTLNSKVKETSPKIKKGGPETVLTRDEEQHLISWMMLMSENGFPVSKTQLLGSVKMLLSTLANKNREHPFKDGVPGQRIAQNLTISRAAISESGIRRWFSEVKEELVLKSLLEIDGNRVFNGDESAFMLDPKKNFTTLLKSAVDTLDIRSIMKNAFKTTGLHPFSADAINYNKLRNKTKGNEEQDNASPQSEDHHALTAMEKYIDPVTLRKFEEVDDDEEWDGDLKDSSLFMVWKSMKMIGSKVLFLLFFFLFFLLFVSVENRFLVCSIASTSAQDLDTDGVLLRSNNDNIDFEFLDELTPQQASENAMQIAIDNDLIIIEAENLHDEPDNEIRIQIEDNPTEEQTVLENIHVQNSLSIEDSRIEENNETLSGNIETSLVEEQQLIVQNKENSTDNFVNKGFNVNENFPLSFREALFWPDKATDKKKRKENLRIKSLLLFLHCNGST
ncbi:Protein of unknown function [Cotesia congregata]|uniref:HTH psq-type domain-containing protein n=1 Tax=Cotesia congregata TaxID=51543 RepID=A0A8J2HJL6_COTCN|nr:Protein of unknown function [Cotesia congregata]